MQQKQNTQEKLREVRGYAIISKGDTPLLTGKNMFTIPSQQGNGSYIITIGTRPTCTCPDFVSRQKLCKHIHAVRFYLDFNNKVKTENKGIVNRRDYDLSVQKLLQFYKTAQ